MQEGIDRGSEQIRHESMMRSVEVFHNNLWMELYDYSQAMYVREILGRELKNCLRQLAKNPRNDLWIWRKDKIKDTLIELERSLDR